MPSYGDENRLLPVNVDRKLFNQPVTTKYDRKKSLEDRLNKDPRNNNDPEGGEGGGFDIAGSIMAGMNGVSSIANTFMDLSSIADTSDQWNEINSVKDVGRTQYSNFDQLSQDYTRMEGMPQSYDYRDIRGKSDGELAMGVGSSMLSGAAAGMQIGGPWGAAAGAAIGLGAGLAGVFSGNAKARREQQFLEDSAVMAEHSATSNLNAGQEQLRDYQFRSGVAHKAAMGGQIERRHESVRQFADRVLHNKPRYISEGGSHSYSIARQHKNGGTVIRIKR